MENQPGFTASPFDTIRKTDEQGNEYWSARDLGKLLGYSQYTNSQMFFAKLKKLAGKVEKSFQITSPTWVR